MYTLHGNWTLQNSPRVSAREVDWLVPNFLKRFPDFSIKSEWSVFWSVHLRYLRTLRVLHSVTSVTWCRGTRGNQLSARTFCFQLLSLIFRDFPWFSVIFLANFCWTFPQLSRSSTRTSLPALALDLEASSQWDQRDQRDQRAALSAFKRIQNETTNIDTCGLVLWRAYVLNDSGQFRYCLQRSLKAKKKSTIEDIQGLARPCAHVQLLSWSSREQALPWIASCHLLSTLSTCLSVFKCVS